MEVAQLDAIVHRLTDEVTEQINCTECWNCCKHTRPTLDKDDIGRFASGLQISTDELHNRSLMPDSDMYKEDFVFRLYGVLDNYAICPIVFNVYERLKDELQYWNREEYDCDDDIGDLDWEV